MIERKKSKKLQNSKAMIKTEVQEFMKRSYFRPFDFHQTSQS